MFPRQKTRRPRLRAAAQGRRVCQRCMQTTNSDTQLASTVRLRTQTIAARLANGLRVPAGGEAALVMSKQTAPQRRRKNRAQARQGRMTRQEARTADRGARVGGQEAPSAMMRTSGASGMAPAQTQSRFDTMLMCLQAWGTPAWQQTAGPTHALRQRQHPLQHDERRPQRRLTNSSRMRV